MPNADPVLAPDAESLFCTFWLSGSLFGIDILDVKEINTETDFTAIPQAPPEVRGYVNLRGEIYLVLDLRRLLGQEAAEIGPESRLVIFKPAVGDAFGVLVDRIGDIVPIAANQIEAWRPEEQEAVEVPGNPARTWGLVAGIGKLPGQLVVLLQARRLLKTVEKSLAPRSETLS